MQSDQLSFSDLLDGLAEKGYAVRQNFVDRETVKLLRKEGEDFFQEGMFKKAGIGRGDDHVIKPEIRGDQVMWLDKNKATSNQKAFLNEMEELSALLNREFFLSLKSYEFMFAIYPAGSFYKKHLDQFQEVGKRQITCILYLNENWKEEDGGQLRMYIEKNGKEEVMDVIPAGGTFVCFRSGLIYHEVLPTQRKRYSITGWLKN